MKEIVQDGAPVLRDVAKPVPEELFGTNELAVIIKDMKEALDPELEGVALAAPQIAVSYRIFVVRKDRTLPPPPAEEAPSAPPPPEYEVYINPEIMKTSRKRVPMDEGCLSVRGVYGAAKRHERVTLRARTIEGSRFERSAGGLMAQIFEHEIDHLNGTLFIDHAEHLIEIKSDVGHAMSHTPKHEFAFFGTPAVASETLAMLIEHGFIPKVVVTSPDAPRGRGLVLTPSPAKTLALAENIPVLTPEKLDPETLNTISALGCDYAVVVAYGKLFPEELINAFPKGVLNVHYSLLPKYRGATPLETALLAGDTETGVTIQQMVRELDAGDIIAQESTPIAPTETARELRPRLIHMGAALLVDTLPAFERGEVAPIAQDASLATRAYKIKKEDGLLDLTASAAENWNKYRAYADSIGTYFIQDGKRMKITSAECAKGTFRVLRVIPEGKREVAYVA